MNRLIIVMLLMALVLTGCGDMGESKPVTKEYIYSEDSTDGVEYRENWTIEGMDDDVLHKTTVIYSYTFNDLEVWAETIEELKDSLDKEISDLQGPFGSPYIIINYTMDGNSLIATETTDYKTALDDGKNVEGRLDVGLMTSDEYYSVKMICEQLEKEGYTLVK